MKIAVIGGSGFIGSHLVERLLTDGHSVCVLDDLSTGSAKNLDGVRSDPNFEYKVGCVTDEEIVGWLVDRAEVIFHLAAAVGVKLIMEHPTHTLNTNIKGTEVVLEAAAKKGKLVVLASTSEVYGKSDILPYNESDDIMLGAATNSRWGYACSKAIDEFLALAYHREKDLPIIITRFFNTIGPRQTGRYGMVVPRFVDQCLREEPITVYGTGEQTRCFAEVSEVVEALIRLMVTPRAVGQIYNIGNNLEISMNDLAKMVRELTLSGSEIIHVPYSEVYTGEFDDVLRRAPSVVKLYEATGFLLSRSLEGTIDRIIGAHELCQTG